MSNPIFRYVIFVFVALCVLIPPVALADETQAPASEVAYQVTLGIKQQKTLLSKPSAIIVAGKRAELTWSEGDSLLQDLRVLLLAEVINKEEVRLTVQVLEQVDGQWILKTEPQILMAHDARVSFRSSLQSYTLGDLNLEFEAQAVVIDGEGMLRDCHTNHEVESILFEATSASHCGGVELLNTALLAQNGPSPRAEDCCSVSCGTGTLSCCGAVRCCDGVCGVCCSPP